MNKRIDELLELYNLPIEELIEISSEITKKNFAGEVELCGIISAKTGLCPENCKYCSQSIHSKTNIETHPLLTLDEVIKAAQEAKDNGAKCFGPVTSGRFPNDEEFYKILEMTEAISNIDGLKACGSYGIILDEEKVKQLRNAGMQRYNHNLNSAKSYYKDVCTSHAYNDRVKTNILMKKNGIDLCCGGIIGMGETRRQRVEMALEIAELNPISVPMNFLTPIEGTPFEKYLDKIDEEEILKTIAIFRIALPTQIIRYAGGRAARFSKENQRLGMIAGVNALMVCNYLTTTGIDLKDDYKMLESLEMSIAK